MSGELRSSLVMPRMQKLSIFYPRYSIFEFLWYLERWDISQAVLGIIAVIAVDRFLLKLFIAVFLSREFKNDHSNNAFWSGRCDFAPLYSNMSPLRLTVVILSPQVVRTRNGRTRLHSADPRAHRQDGRDVSVCSRLYGGASPAVLACRALLDPIL